MGKNRKNCLLFAQNVKREAQQMFALEMTNAERSETPTKNNNKNQLQ